MQNGSSHNAFISRKISIFLAVSILVASPLAAADSIEQRLSRLEAQVEELRQENRELRERLGLAAKARTAMAEPGEAAPPKKAEGEEPDREDQGPTLSFRGLLHVQAESGGRLDSRFSDDNDRVFLRRARIAAFGTAAPNVDYKVELDLAGTMASSGGLTAHATDVYAEWDAHPAMNIRAGQFKTPYGYEQLYADPEVLTVERTLGNDRITLGRQLGIQLGGDLAGGRISYAVGAFNGNGTNVTFNDDDGFLTAGRVTATLLDSSAKWSVGANGFTSSDQAADAPPELGLPGDEFRGHRGGWGIDSQWQQGPAQLFAEILRARYDPDEGVAQTLSAWSLLGVWNLTNRVQALARYDSFDVGNFEQGTWTVGTNYLIRGSDVKLQLNLMHIDGEDRLMARVQTAF
jgi:phosphate-selective porin OprO and OprP